jgi:hypothetical protein
VPLKIALGRSAEYVLPVRSSDQAMNNELEHADLRAIRDQMKQSKRRGCGL